MNDSALVALLHLCDSLFPIGSFAHSDGLEAATAAGAVETGDDLRSWMTVCLDEGFGRLEGPAFLLASHAFAERRWSDLRKVDAEVRALRPSSAARQASRAMGARVLKTWQQIRPHADIEPFGRDANGTGLTLPIAFAVVCSASGIDERSALTGYIYTRLTATASAAMRLIAMGQHEAHFILSDVLREVPRVVDAVIEREGSPEAFTPAMDIAAMSQQYVHSRLFRS